MGLWSDTGLLQHHRCGVDCGACMQIEGLKAFSSAAAERARRHLDAAVQLVYSCKDAHDRRQPSAAAPTILLGCIDIQMMASRK